MLEEEREKQKEEGPKRYPIPEELEEMIIKSEAFFRLRDCYVKLPFFGYKRAKQLAFEATKLQYEYWKKVRELYPELDPYGLAHLDNHVWVIGKDEYKK